MISKTLNSVILNSVDAIFETLWWITPIIPALRRLRPGDCYRCEASLSFMVSLRLD